jgi:hypothetical protein
MRRFLSRLFLVPLALLFLFEAWLWDRCAPIVAAFVALLPLQRLKAWVRSAVSRLSPAWTLVVFLVPALLLVPLKLLGLWFFARHLWLPGVLTIVFAKLVGVGVTAFLFDLTRPKLLEMAWFRVFYEWMLRIRAAAHALVAPVQEELRRYLRLFAPGAAGRTLRLLRRLRRQRRLGMLK